MRKVAVFGNAGGGKSTLARKLAELTRLPLYPLDRIQFRPGGGEVPPDEYAKAHAELLTRDAWIIDGYGSVKSAWERFDVADTLVYVDLPLFTHFRWVTKRLVQGIVKTPEGFDILVHASGRHYLLEANFPCYFALPETIAGVDVSGALVEHLVAKSRRLVGRVDAAGR